MAEKRMTLSDLQELLRKYRDSLKAARSVQAYKRDGTRKPVDKKAVDDAVRALDAAATSLDGVCQDAVLAIVVEEDNNG